MKFRKGTILIACKGGLKNVKSKKKNLVLPVFYSIDCSCGRYSLLLRTNE